MYLNATYLERIPPKASYINENFFDFLELLQTILCATEQAYDGKNYTFLFTQWLKQETMHLDAISYFQQFEMAKKETECVEGYSHSILK